MLPCADLKQLPPDDSYSACVRESHKVMFDTAEKAMAAAGIEPRQVNTRSKPFKPAACVPARAFGARCALPASLSSRKVGCGRGLPAHAPACLCEREGTRGQATCLCMPTACHQSKA